ncbi:MAG TPA: methyltransferase domain-containing protein [Longimicrobiales bacterium]
MNSGPAAYFSDRAPQYARSRPTYPPRLADWLADAAPARGTVWEAGCGSGQLTTLLGDRFGRVVATDISAEQLAHAPAHARVHYVASSAEAAPVRERAADLVVAAQAAHWFDLPRFFAEARRVARPGALVALVGYGNAVLDDDAFERRFVRFYDDEIGRFWPAQRRILLDGYASIDFPFDDVEPPALELARDWTAGDMIAYVDTWSAVRVARRAGADHAFARFATELRELWGDRIRRVRWPLPVRAGRV